MAWVAVINVCFVDVLLIGKQCRDKVELIHSIFLQCYKHKRHSSKTLVSAFENKHIRNTDTPLC